MAKARFQLYQRGFDGLGWRFVASNNRDLARSPEAYDDEDEARADVDTLRLVVGGCRASTYLDAAGRWRWMVQHGGTRLAESSRWYYRRVECEGTMSQFLAACAEAQLSTTVVGVRRPVEDLVIDLIAFESAPRKQIATLPAQRAVVAARRSRSQDVRATVPRRSSASSRPV